MSGFEKGSAAPLTTAGQPRPAVNGVPPCPATPAEVTTVGRAPPERPTFLLLLLRALSVPEF